MPRLGRRRRIISRARAATGGTQAPRRAAGQRMGVGPGRPVHRPRLGLAQATPAAPAGAGGPAAAGAAPAHAPTPWSARGAQLRADALRSYLSSSSDLDLAKTSAEQDFGLAGPYADAKTNPNSRAALLEQSFRNANRGTMNTAGYQLYSGSTGNQLYGNRAGYGRDRDQLEKLYRDTLGGIDKERTEAADRKAREEADAAWEETSDAEDKPLDPEAAVAGDRRKRRRRRGRGPGIGPGRPAQPRKRRR